MTVRFSLQNGVCEESISAFVIFAYFQVFLKQSFDQGRHWANIAKNMLEKASAEDPVTRARFLLFSFVNFWYVPLQESSNHMQKIHDLSLKVGDIESAYLAQCLRFKFLFFQGERLSSLSHSADTYLQSMVSTRPRVHCCPYLLKYSRTPLLMVHTTCTGQVQYRKCKIYRSGQGNG